MSTYEKKTFVLPCVCGRGGGWGGGWHIMWEKVYIMEYDVPIYFVLIL